MPQGGKETPVSTGLIARAVQGVRYAISGVTPSSWMNPGQPLAPMAPPEVAGRLFDYPVGYNINSTPRGEEPVSFGQLRFLADNCDVLRAVIETRKDQMEAIDWTVRPKSKGRKNTVATDEQMKRIDQITAFLQSPDRVNSWSQWQRQLLEDRFVTDAAALYKRRDRKGRLYGLEVVDGATIKVLIDDHGRRPVPPDPAYQQILKGIPAVDYTADELLYLVRNPRSWKFYGYSEVEQIIVTVNISIRRALHQLEYYREGSQPDAFLGLPKEWNADQIIAFQKHFDSQMAGNLAARRKLKMVPGDAKYQETKQPPLKDQYDEWLARVICFVFSISPEGFVQQMNKGTSETSHDRAVKEGLQPLQRWIKGVIDPVIALEFDSPDLEFTWQDDREMDPKQADDILVNDTKAGIISIDEAREAKGLEPIGGACAIPMALTSAGYVVIDPEERAAMAPQPLQPGVDEKDGKEGDGETPGPDEDEDGKADDDAQKAAYTRLRKAAGNDPVPFDRPATRRARKALKANLAKILTATGKDAAAQVVSELGRLAKDDAEDEANRQRAARIAENIDLGTLEAVIDAVPEQLEAVLADSGGRAIAQVGVTESAGLVDQVNDRAVEYSRQRAAEMVGKRWEGDVLIDNPNAAWRIDEATRNELRAVIERGLSENIGQDAIAKLIEEAGAFSEARAELIAGAEVARANSVGTLEGYKAARALGIKIKKVWLTDDEPCLTCLANAAVGAIDLDADFPSGDDAPIAHPNCECVLTNEIEED